MTETIIILIGIFLVFIFIGDRLDKGGKFGSGSTV